MRVLRPPGCHAFLRLVSTAPQFRHDRALVVRLDRHNNRRRSGLTSIAAAIVVDVIAAALVAGGMRRQVFGAAMEGATVSVGDHRRRQR